MPKPITILGIETSCDETSAAVIRVHNDHIEILSNVTASQVPIHRKYGGVVPEVAARNHVVTILPTIEHALVLAGIPKIDTIAVTSGPGLMVALQVGVETAKTLAYVWKKPLIRVNHLAGHVYANWLPSKLSAVSCQLTAKLFPALALIVSGGHTELVLMKRHLHFQKIGATLDDAAGEAFDKIGSLLGLPYPAGPEIDRLSKTGDSTTFKLPRPIINTPDFNFSFSGLKTAALYTIKRETYNVKHASRFTLHDSQDKANFAASVQKAIVDVLIAKTIRAAKQYKVKTVLLAGGVAANSELRERLGQKIKEQLPSVSCKLPAKGLTTDNGAMIAAAGYFMYRAKKFTPWQKIKADPNWEL